MSRFVNELPTDSLAMIVVEVQTPSSMWLVDVMNKNMTKKYYDVEALLKQVMDRQGILNFSQLFYVGDIVAVYDAVSGVWSRAKICDIYQKLSKYIYTLFLLDRGYSITAEASNIRELPSEAMKLQFRCYHVQLHGIIPFPNNKRIICPQNIALQAWPSGAMDEVKDLVNSCEAVYFTLKVARKIVYGDIHLKFNHGYLNLGNYLCDNKFAYYDISKFSLLMEKSAYMSREESISSGTRTECNSAFNNTKERQKPGNESKSFVDWDSEFQSTYPNSSDADSTSKLANGNHSPEISGERLHQRRTLGLLRFCEEMRSSDAPHNLLHNKRNEDRESTRKNLCYIGRGERLELLKGLSSGRKPGGIINFDNQNDEAVTLMKDLSLDGSRSLTQELCTERFESESAHASTRQFNFDSKNVYKDNSVSSHHNSEAPQHESIPESRSNVFCKQNKKIVYIPAGAEMSMLSSQPKKSKDKRK